MSWNRLKAWCLTGCLLCAALFSGCAAPDGGAPNGGETAQTIPELPADAYNLGYVVWDQADPLAAAYQEALETALQDTDIHLTLLDGAGDLIRQAEQVALLLQKGVDALLVYSMPEGLPAASVSAANAAGVPLICTGMRPLDGDYFYIGPDDYLAGQLQGELLADALPKDASIAYLTGILEWDGTKQRKKGLQDSLKDAGREDVRFLSSQDGDDNRAEGRRIAETWLQKFEPMPAVVAADDRMALGALDALQEANRQQGVVIVGIGGLYEAREAIRDGKMLLTVIDMPAQRAQAVAALIDSLRNGETPEQEILVQPERITAENAFLPAPEAAD